MFENTFTYKTTLRVLEMLFHMVKFWLIIFTVRFGKSPLTALFRAVVKTTTKSARKNAWWSCSRSRDTVCNSAKPCKVTLG